MPLLLLEHDWPGNVRELENVIERMALECLLAGVVPSAAALRGVLDPSGPSEQAPPQALPQARISLDMAQRTAEVNASARRCAPTQANRPLPRSNWASAERPYGASCARKTKASRAWSRPLRKVRQCADAQEYISK